MFYEAFNRALRLWIYEIVFYSISPGAMHAIDGNRDIERDRDKDRNRDRDKQWENAKKT